MAEGTAASEVGAALAVRVGARGAGAGAASGFSDSGALADRAAGAGARVMPPISYPFAPLLAHGRGLVRQAVEGVEKDKQPAAAN